MIPILLNLCLGAFKWICGSVSGLASISADAANNLTDAVTALMTALGVKAASTLGGKRHKNGHGRLEWVVGIVVSCSIMLVGWESLGNSIEAIKDPAAPEFSVPILLVMLVSIGIKVYLFFYQTKKSRENNSSAYKAAAADCISDAVSTSVVVITFLTDSLLHLHMDGWGALVVSLFIIRNGLKSFAEISRRVLGEVEDAALSEQLKDYVLAYHPELIREVADLQVLDYGYERYGASFAVRANEGADRGKFLLLVADLKSDIYQKFGYLATIQPEVPTAPEEERQIREIICRKVKEVDENLTVDEDTRINEGAARPQVILYLTIPFEYSSREREIHQKIKEKLEGEAFSCTIKLMAGKGIKYSRGRRSFLYRQEADAR